MKNENHIQTTEELTQDQWWLILWSFITDLPEKEWNEFSHDLIYKNRFSSSHKVVDIIEAYAERCKTKLKKDQVLYRARIYYKDPLLEFLSDIFKYRAENDDSEIVENINEFYNMQLAAITMAVEKGGSGSKEIINIYNRWKRKRFKGYNASESGAPPSVIGSAGRINPARIRYLYLTEEPDTAIYEVRPTIGQNVSVATFKIKDDITIYDLAKELKPTVEQTMDYDHVLFNVIQKRFSEPNTGDDYRYLPTQYLGEIIKQMGFDGLRFKSSLKNGGINVVLFDDTKCRAIRSDIVKVGDIEMKLDKPDIYQLGGFWKID